MSGGVDSAVSAYLLKEQGFDVTGVFIKTWQPDYIECTWKNDRLDAMRICAQLNVPFKTLDLEKDYKEHVIDYMLGEYAKNNTPNPDIMCNKYIKFDGFLNFARACGARIATGHYAKISQYETGPYLVNAKDESKDQTYFLYQIKKENLNDVIFPLSDLKKEEVKEIARKNNLYVANKKESMGICMLGDISMKDFLIKELNPKSGDVCNQSGEIIGIHDGVILYTIGERHGFEVLKNVQNENSNSLPYFIYEKDNKQNILYVTQNENKIIEKQKLDFENGMTLKEVNSFINLENLNSKEKEILENKTYICQTRYHGEKYNIKIKTGNIENLPDSKKNINNLLKIIPENTENFFAVSGQSLVVFDGKKLIFGGVI
jgi:tRNA-specific 2-thiouridylase